MLAVMISPFFTDCHERGFEGDLAVVLRRISQPKMLFTQNRRIRAAAERMVSSAE
jgi:hypothetical protein